MPADSPFCRRAGAFVLLGTLCLCWPMLLQRGALVFFDTGGYLWHGWQVVDAAARVLGAPEGVPDPAGGGVAASPSGPPSTAASGTTGSPAGGSPAGDASDARGALDTADG